MSQAEARFAHARVVVVLVIPREISRVYFQLNEKKQVIYGCNGSLHYSYATVFISFENNFSGLVAITLCHRIKSVGSDKYGRY